MLCIQYTLYMGVYVALTPISIRKLKGKTCRDAVIYDMIFNVS